MSSRQLYVVTCATVASKDLYIDVRPQLAVDQAQAGAVARWQQRYGSEDFVPDIDVRIKLYQASRMFRLFDDDADIRTVWDDIDRGHPSSMGIVYSIKKMTVAEINQEDTHPGTTLHWPPGHTVFIDPTETTSLGDRLLKPR